MKKKPIIKHKQKKHKINKIVNTTKKTQKTKIKLKIKTKTIRNKTTEKKTTAKKTIKKAEKKADVNKQVSKQKDNLKNLIAKGKDQGYLTFTEVNDHLPPEIVDPDQIEDIIGMLNEDMGIPIYDETPEVETLLLNETTPTVTEEEQATPTVTVEDETGRTSDPVRMYMREMGSVELLTRSGEITIAKKIEAELKYPGEIKVNLLRETRVIEYAR